MFIAVSTKAATCPFTEELYQVRTYPFTRASSYCSLFNLFNQARICISLLPHACHMTDPFQPP